MKLRAAALGVLALAIGPASAMAAAKPPPCFAIVGPRQLAQHSGHPWRAGAPVWLHGDVAVCHYYQQEVPGGFSLAVRDDPEGKYFRNTREFYGDRAVPDGDLGPNAFYFRVAAAKPFEPSWGLILHADYRTYRVDGVPEAGKVEAARTLAREIIQRAMKRY